MFVVRGSGVTVVMAAAEAPRPRGPWELEAPHPCGEGGPALRDGGWVTASGRASPGKEKGGSPEATMRVMYVGASSPQESGSFQGEVLSCPRDTHWRHPGEKQSLWALCLGWAWVPPPLCTHPSSTGPTHGDQVLSPQPPPALPCLGAGTPSSASCCLRCVPHPL